MVTITFTWHLIVLIVVIIAGFSWAITRDGTSGWMGSERGWATMLWFILTVMAVLIYGGIVWW